MKKVNASPAPPIAHPANHNQSVRLVYLDSNLTKCNMNVLSIPIVLKSAVMEKDSSSTAMTATPRTTTVVMKTVKSKADGIVKEDLVLKLAPVFLTHPPDPSLH